MRTKFTFLILLTAFVGVSFYSTAQAQSLPAPWLDYPNFSVALNTNPINLLWHLNSPMPAGATYHLQVSTHSDFSSPVLDNAGISTNSYSNFVMDPSTTYYWRVRLDSASSSSSWTSGWFSSASNIPSGITYTVTVTPAVTHGTITSSGIVGSVLTVHSGDTPYFTITPNSGYKISSITVNGSTPVTVTSPYGQTYQFPSITSNQTITASFDTVTTSSLPTPWLDYPNFSVALNVNPVNLAWHLISTAPSGAKYHLQISTNSDFSSPVLDVSNIDTTGYNGFVMTASTTYYWRVRLETTTDSSAWGSGWFAAGPSLPSVATYTITASAGSGGTISPSGSVSVNSGNSQAFTITPLSGYHVADVLVDASSIGAVTSHTFTNVIANHAIAASFALDNTYYVDGTQGTDDGSHGTSPGTGAWKTIQFAINNAPSGSVINVAAGTYSVDHLSVNNNVTLNGANESTTNITITGTATYGILVNVSNVTMQNFTINMAAANNNYVIHVSNAPTELKNLNFNHLTINSVYRTGLDVNTVDSLSVSYITSQNATHGNGVSVSGVKNANLSHVTTSGNAWGGIAVYVSYQSTRGSDSVTVDGATCNLGEVNKLYSQDEGGYFNTHVFANGFGYMYRNTDVAGFTWYQVDLSTVSATLNWILTDKSGSVAHSYIQSTSAPYDFYVENTMNIQTAINQAVSGNTINIGAGLYVEDLTITTSNLKFVGADASTTKIKGVTVEPTASAPLASPNIDIRADSVVFHNFTIESPDVTGGHYSSGIVFYGKGIQFYNNIFHSVATSASNLVQGDGYCIVMQSWSTSNYSSADISGLNIHNNSFTFDELSPVGGGIPSYEGIYLNRHNGSGNITISNNTFSGNLYRAIATETSNTTISGNTISTNLTSGTDAAYTTGIWVIEKSNITITQNNISGFAAGSGLKLGRYPLTGFLAVALDPLNNVSVTKNTIKDNLIGINIRADLSSYVNGDNPIVINNNSIFDNTQSGLEVTDGIGAGAGGYEFLDATNNWWGNANGPKDDNYYDTAPNTGTSAELPTGSASPVNQWVNKAPSGNLGNQVVDRYNEGSGKNLFIKYYPWNTGTPSLYFTDQTSVTGATFSIPIYISSAGNSFNTLQGKFTYDHSKLSFQNATYGLGTLINSAGWTIFFSETTPGTITFAGIGLTPINSDGLLFYLTFTVTDGAAGSAVITGDNADFKADGSQIFGTSGSFAGTVTYTHISTTYLRGDVNLDGSVTLADALLLQNKITNNTLSTLSDLAKQNSDADLSSGDPSTTVPSDTSLTTMDVAAILQYVSSGSWPASVTPKLTLPTMQFANASIGSNQLLHLPISVDNATGVQTLEVTLTYDSQTMNYQTFAQLKLNNGDLLDAQKVSDGVVKFVYVSKTPSSGNILPGEIILKLNNGIPTSGNVSTTYRINGGAVKAGPSYVFGVTAVNGKNAIPKEFSVDQNYPNPFNPTTVIEYALPKSSEVTIKIYNMLGQEVKTLVNGAVPAGIHTVQWNGDNNFGQHVASGAYIYRVVAGQYAKTMKMILLK